MLYNILTDFGFLTREEYETHCFQILPDGMNPPGEGEFFTRGVKWAVRPVKTKYPKTLGEAGAELRQRGLDPGDRNYGLAKIIEDGEVVPRNSLWEKDDIDSALISLAELGCIEPWIHVCKAFNIRPIDYVKTHREIAEKYVGQLGQNAESPLFFRYEFGYANGLSEPGVFSITLRDDWEQVLRQINEGTEAAKERQAF
ncbi:MAG: hypothetical protein FWC43_08570 [Planctomycetaceae bacterium]|nr:hypothetical protein [Planctomycetaceae bacterium]